MKFVEHSEAMFEIPKGIYLLQWLTDNSDHRKILVKFYDQVMMNNGRKAVFVKKAGMISLFVNKVADSKPKYKAFKKGE